MYRDGLFYRDWSDLSRVVPPFEILMLTHEGSLRQEAPKIQRKIPCVLSDNPGKLTPAEV